MADVTVTAAEVRDGESVVTIDRTDTGAYRLSGTGIEAVVLDGYDAAVAAATDVAKAIEAARLIVVKAQSDVDAAVVKAGTKKAPK